MLSINGIPVEVEHFQDNTQKLHISDFECNPFHIEWKYSNDEELVTLIFICGYLRDNYPDCTIRLEMLYVPNARMDRVEEKGDVFTLKYFCNVINSLQFDSVIVFDTHSKVTDALVDRMVKIPTEELLQKVLDTIHVGYFDNKFKSMTIVFPDRGAYDRYSSLEILKPFKKIIGNKSRDWKTGTLQDQELYGVDQLETGVPVLIIDDILSSGGTICKTISNIREVVNCPIYVYVSHCENKLIENNTENWEYIQGNINRMFTTNGIYSCNCDKIEKVV